jgi:formylglycine-generating enzyme required for sulfatase activity
VIRNAIKVLVLSAVLAGSWGCGRAVSGAQMPLSTLSDCDDGSVCPEMVILPKGEFVMGSPPGEAGRFSDETQRTVRVGAFAIAKYPVTRRQWRAFVEATHHRAPDGSCAYAPTDHASWDNPGFPQTDLDPVVCVTWSEANDYARWLTAQSHHSYRLPTDAEWEYAARAGTRTAYPWGDTPSHDHANYGADEGFGLVKSGRDQWDYTSPVGSFPPNAFGLFDMNGNVTQWVSTCADAEEPGILHPNAEGCGHRFARGGLYGDRPALMRSAARNFAPPPDEGPIANYRSSGFGLRVARDL